MQPHKLDEWHVVGQWARSGQQTLSHSIPDMATIAASLGPGVDRMDVTDWPEQQSSCMQWMPTLRHMPGMAHFPAHLRPMLHTVLAGTTGSMEYRTGWSRCHIQHSPGAARMGAMWDIHRLCCCRQSVPYTAPIPDAQVLEWLLY